MNNLCLDKSINPSVAEIALALETQFEVECLVGDTALYKEMCLIIAVVLSLPTQCLLRIAQQPLPAGHVQEMYSMLKGSHLEMVYESFNACNYEIKNKVMWFRTALYNSVMQLESHYTNQVNADIGGLR